MFIISGIPWKEIAAMFGVIAAILGILSKLEERRQNKLQERIEKEDLISVIKSIRKCAIKNFDKCKNNEISSHFKNFRGWAINNLTEIKNLDQIKLEKLPSNLTKHDKIKIKCIYELGNKHNYLIKNMNDKSVDYSNYLYKYAEMPNDLTMQRLKEICMNGIEELLALTAEYEEMN